MQTLTEKQSNINR